jgi:hypothetical protein
MALHGEGEVLLDMAHAFDPQSRSCVIDAATAVGRDLSKLFHGLIVREFGRDAFRAERVAARPEPVPA